MPLDFRAGGPYDGHMAKKAPKKEEASRRRGGYPYYLLKPSIRLGEIVAKSGGDRVGVPKSVVASGLDVDQGSSTFAQMVASAKTFGIVDGTTDLRLTDLGSDYFLPTTPSATRAAELGFVAAPAAFEFLIKKFDGSMLPGATILGNLLAREFGMSDSWKTRVAQMFVSTVNEFGLVDQSGRLRYSAAKHSAGSTAPYASADASDSGPTTVTPGPAHLQLTGFAPEVRLGGAPVGSSKTSTWIHGAIRVETPDPLPQQVWEQLEQYVKLLKPAQEAKEVTQMVLEEKLRTAR